VKGVVNVTDIKCSEDSMVKLLQERGGGVGQTLKLERNPVDVLEHYQGQ
jgi:hypothetical protein